MTSQCVPNVKEYLLNHISITATSFHSTHDLHAKLAYLSYNDLCKEAQVVIWVGVGQVFCIWYF